MVSGRAEAPLDCQAKPPLVQEEPKIRGERKKVLLGNNTIVWKNPSFNRGTLRHLADTPHPSQVSIHFNKRPSESTETPSG